MKRTWAWAGLATLCLAAAYGWGARTAEADWERQGRICGVGAGTAETFLVVSRTGEAWIHDAGAWTRREDMDLPVSVEAVKFLAGHGTGAYLLVTSDDVVWHFASGQWQQSDEFTGGAVTFDEEKLGSYKAHGG